MPSTSVNSPASAPALLQTSDTSSGIRQRPPLLPTIPPPKLSIFRESQLDRIPQLAAVPAEERFAMRVVAQVLPFRVNQHVIDELINWANVPEDPVFQLVFPQRGMLSDDHFGRMASLLKRGASKSEIGALAKEIRSDLNPHPGGQQEYNVPKLRGEALAGVQHKYRETVLFFPSQGQTCHSYCTFCFRWAQFVGDKELHFASSDVEQLTDYLTAHPNVTDLLLTGGDPMVMRTRNLAGYIEALLRPELEHVQTIRIGSKSLTFWPQRYVTDRDADDLLRLFDKAVKSGKHVTLMAHVNHWQEWESDMCLEAVRRLRDVGVVIRSQAPLLDHINNDPVVWETMWRKQVSLGVIPYYMFVERDTGTRRYFEVPLARCYEVYRDAIQRVSGLARTARGPSMSATPGKVEIQGITEIAGEKVFVLRFVQARDASITHKPFFAKFDPKATWLNQLEPALAPAFPF